MSGQARNLPGLRIQPNSMLAALTEQDTALLVPVTFHVGKLHTPVSSMVSRTALGERFRSVSSR